MFSPLIKKRLSLCFGAVGIGLMGADLMITHNFFTHIAELMIASISCLVLALVFDRAASKTSHKEDP